MPRGEAQITVHLLDGRPHRREIGQGLPHAHQHDVAEPAPAFRGTAARAEYHLLDDLSGGEVAPEAGVARRAEPTAHRAAGLARDADGRTVAIAHENRLDTPPVGGLEQQLHSRAAVRDALANAGERRGQAWKLLEPVANLPRKLRQLRGLR